ncbi:MAG: hypothetical protein E7456_06950 [Ruminococcaceae bacterium]|nr:hypothetical protein [Oscillospiraceae bacterium]
MKKLIPLIFAMLILCGCSSLLEISVEQTTPHNSSTNVDTSDPTFIEVSDYDDLRQAMYLLISNHEETGIIRFSSYDGDIEQDLNNACIYIANDTAIGSYSGAYVASTLNRLVTYYEATVSITYQKDASQVEGIISVNSIADLEPVITEAMKNCVESFAIKTTSDAVDANSINSVMRSLYYADPQLIVSMPAMDIIKHSDTTQIGHIYEVNMEYINSASIMNERRNFLLTFKTQLDPEFSNIQNEPQLLYQLCLYLSNRTDYIGNVTDEEYNQSAMVNTAYGALQQVRASSEGFAMAMKLLCDWYDIDCKVVSGRYDNYIHTWNLIKVDGNWYHFDITKLSSGAAGSVMRTDSQMMGSYSWDTAAYPVCKGNLNYTYLTGAPQSEQPASVTEPVRSPSPNDPEQSEAPED